MKLVDIGLLVVKGQHGVVEKKLQRLLKGAISRVRHKLYVHLEDADGKLAHIISLIYHTAWKINPQIDLRVLLNRTRSLNVDKVFRDGINDPDMPIFPVILEGTGPELYDPTKNLFQAGCYDNVVLGGTFDRLHNGHKMLLSAALLIANKSLICGMTDGDMIKSTTLLTISLEQDNLEKLLWELIESVEKRSDALQEFVSDVSDGIKCETVPIYDPFGPAITMPDLNCIVVSNETQRGGEAVNSKRKTNGLSPLKMHIIDLLGDQDQVINETKISSSSIRRKLLGTQLREPELLSKEILSSTHYLIGLTGGIASGKTHISKYLESLDCEVIDCDGITREVYEVDEDLHTKLVSAFGPKIMHEWGSVDRTILGEIVFNDKEKLAMLNSLVWPAIFKSVKIKIGKSNKRIVVIDAALLLESNWDKYVHQVWTVFVPREEALRRICARDGLTEEQALARLNSQFSNSDRIAKSNVVFCSLWDFAETERQVSNALKNLNANTLHKKCTFNMH